MKPRCLEPSFSDPGGSVKQAVEWPSAAALRIMDPMGGRRRRARSGDLKLALALLLAVAGPSLAEVPRLPDVSPEAVAELGRLIWMNEGRGLPRNLVSWNAGEAFPSLGIGHFIWFPEGVDAPFEESFPALRDRLQEAGYRLPAWLAGRNAPWPDREAFLAARDSAEMGALQALLQASVDVQARYIIDRMAQRLPRLFAAAGTSAERRHAERQFARVAADPRGLYALVDYTHFKGDGASPSERYRGEGWGLLQVLVRMDPEAPDALAAFVEAAGEVLTQRVANAGRDETRWLPGWRRRLETYLEPSLLPDVQGVEPVPGQPASAGSSSRSPSRL